MAATTQENDIAVSAKTKRLLSIDLLRGALLVIILIGHLELPPNLYDFFTGRGRLLVSAAEGFFFMSGLLVGMVYRRKLSLGMRYIFKKMWTRAFELYLGSVVLTLLCAFIVAKTNHFYIKPGLPNPVDWSHIISQTFLLRYTYGWADFLGRFAILMLFAPIVFYLIAKGRWKLVLVGIIMAWALRRDNFTLGWQIIFNGGMLIGYYWNELLNYWRKIAPHRQQLIKKSAITITAITFILSYATVYVLSQLNEYFKHLPDYLKSFTLGWNQLTYDIWLYAQKWTMGPLRVVLFFIWAAVIYAWVTPREQFINQKTRGIFVLLGQNSLFVYIYHSVIIFTFKFFIPARTNILENFIITTLALILLIGGTYYYTQQRAKRPHINLSRFYGMVFKKSRALPASK